MANLKEMTHHTDCHVCGEIGRERPCEDHRCGWYETKQDNQEPQIDFVAEQLQEDLTDTESLANFIRDKVCCARPTGGCECRDYPESCPAERVREVFRFLISERDALVMQIKELERDVRLLSDMMSDMLAATIQHRKNELYD